MLNLTPVPAPSPNIASAARLLLHALRRLCVDTVRLAGAVSVLYLLALWLGLAP